MVITSRQNASVKQIRELMLRRKARYESGLYIVEGIKPVECARAFNLAVKTVGIEEDCDVVVSPEVYGSMTDMVSPEGILAIVKMPSYAVEPPKGSCIILDGVSDPGNVGAVIRTAVAVGIEDIYFCEGSCDPFSPKAVRASMSGIMNVSVHIGTKEEIFGALSGCKIVVADLSGENVFSTRVEEPFALVLGNEANGVSDFFTERANKTVSIPMSGKIESLNVSVAAGILMYALSK